MEQHFRLQRHDTVNFPDGAYRFDFELHGEGLFFVRVHDGAYQILSTDQLNQAWLEGRVQRGRTTRREP